MQNRPALLAIALIAFVLAPLLACCGAEAASSPLDATSASHDCGHGPVPEPEPTEHADCDGCEDCAPGGRDVLQPQKTVDGSLVAIISDELTYTSSATSRAPRRFVRLLSTAPPRASPVELHVKITV
ncbi:hypothetical protein [Parvularcula dongshanensis]|uniref:Secreted protein n=1 Tax=Parvularcula dongshanensis TaxID=1173995 RepID=A0A840I5Z8_9PROT|nr:hypothetical protein [Parvularcula dongshanensis]MBB4660247.1 hypothetical protein [Parvularcula dongshanensis]